MSFEILDEGVCPYCGIDLEKERSDWFKNRKGGPYRYDGHDCRMKHLHSKLDKKRNRNREHE